MESRVTDLNNSERTVNAINPTIIVTGKVDKPYYEVMWYDVDSREWCIGYSSYDLSIVHDYIEQYFNVIEKYADMQIVRYGHWEWFEEWSPITPEHPREVEDCGWRCGNCKTALEDSVGGYWDDYTEKPKVKYCPECGAKMCLKGDYSNGKTD